MKDINQTHELPSIDVAELRINGKPLTGVEYYCGSFTVKYGNDSGAGARQILPYIHSYAGYDPSHYSYIQDGVVKTVEGLYTNALSDKKVVLFGGELKVALGDNTGGYPIEYLDAFECKVILMNAECCQSIVTGELECAGVLVYIRS